MDIITWDKLNTDEIIYDAPQKNISHSSSGASHFTKSNALGCILFSSSRGLYSDCLDSNSNYDYSNSLPLNSYLGYVHDAV